MMITKMITMIIKMPPPLKWIPFQKVRVRVVHIGSLSLVVGLFEDFLQI